MPAVEVRDLDKAFRGGIIGARRKVALHNVNLTVKAGMIYGILGPNGAGKTTLFSILATLLLPDCGSVRVLGRDIRREARLIRSRINMASGNANFPWCLTAPEVLTFHAMLYGLWGKRCRARVQEVMEICELTQYATIPYNELSTGLKPRLPRMTPMSQPPATRCQPWIGAMNWYFTLLDHTSKRRAKATSGPFMGSPPLFGPLVAGIFPYLPLPRSVSEKYQTQ